MSPALALCDVLCEAANQGEPVREGCYPASDAWVALTVLGQGLDAWIDELVRSTGLDNEIPEGDEHD